MNGTSDKKRLVAFLLCFLLGCLGVHRFYVGRIPSGCLQILTFGGLGIWALIDFVLILCGVFKDRDGDIVSDWT